MKTISTPITYEKAIDSYYGGIKGLSSQKFPFTCKCGSETYPEKRNKEKVATQIPVLSTTDCFKHIKRVHKEKLIK